MTNTKVLYLIGGSNGSGKTTLAKELLKKYPDLHFMNADEIAAEYGLDSIAAGRILLQKMHDALESGFSFVWETTLSGGYQKKFLRMAHDAGYTVIFSYVTLASPEQNVARVQQRVALGGHDVPEDVIRRRCVASEGNREPTCEMSDSWIEYYNGDKQVVEIERGGADYGMFEEIKLLANYGAARARIIANRAGLHPMYKNIQETRYMAR